jgi:hypothetical protein
MSLDEDRASENSIYNFDMPKDKPMGLKSILVSPQDLDNSKKPLFDE